MKFLLAPDSFKGSVSAKEAAEAMRRGVLKARPSARTFTLPLSDGGEGTLEHLVKATKGTIYETMIEDPLGRPICGYYGVTGDGKTAIVELATASGLTLLKKEELNPRLASTFGTGQLIMRAMERGIASFIICLGGSATVDGGAGILQALGFRLLDHCGEELPRGGVYLRELAHIDDSRVDEGIKQAKFRLACDVTNPLLGPQGAAYVFGPQKGADKEAIRELGEALTVWADQIRHKTGVAVHDMPGAGAAGGTAAGLCGLLGAEIRPGFAIVSEMLGLERLLDEHSITAVLTGEGRLDAQTAGGKVVAGVCAVCAGRGIPVIAVVGGIDGDISPLYGRGLTAAFSLVDGPLSVEEAMGRATVLLEKQTEQIVRVFVKAKGM
ncbi:glycerate kinase [Aneurinibacillus thermoaerophilus]|uniref:Glycerate kinase n=1 Tax=Aneurinibacillus thermoaerophilus TaxID=143495 RepID=A0A1G8A5A7_ANETH|nr:MULTISPECIES: glycerate kinase [Aneurinibacillus]AMA74104.1 glycerate kinase [Aneurinibacillus sp. XH2]MED0675481.1 glycerate kinase [Aneurinibacillus thermoaerophilus]MED0678836.1 glycerate kinase [Aneurinibacillus thermoaerophilus]MED0758364.1 glycerate kinase [Aneurinibacillus thermoaerophilus]MED0759829.1 glycerate kinase [Aneurinibacillus thermoaerophilus]